MAIRYKPLDEIDEHDLEDLIGNQTPESKYLDYKRDFPKNTDSKKAISD